MLAVISPLAGKQTQNITVHKREHFRQYSMGQRSIKQAVRRRLNNAKIQEAFAGKVGVSSGIDWDG